MHSTDNASIRTESSYYDEICTILQENVSHGLASLGQYKVRFQKCGTKDMLWGLKQIHKSLSQSEYLPNQGDQITQDLFVDIVGLVCRAKDARKNTRIICEVKLKTLTLNDYAQLLGYCVTANAQHGLLIAIDNGVSSRFDSILRHNESLKSVERSHITHKFGILKFKSRGGEIQFNEIGYYKSWHILARALVRSVDKVV